MVKYLCEVCGMQAGSGAALASHVRWRHPAGLSEDGGNAAAAALMLAELDRMGRLEQVDVARRQAVLSLAAAVDTKPDNPGLWREYRALLDDLLTRDEDADDELAAALAQIGGGPALGDS